MIVCFMAMLFKVSLNVIIAVWTNRNDQRHIKS